MLVVAPQHSIRCLSLILAMLSLRYFVTVTFTHQVLRYLVGKCDSEARFDACCDSPEISLVCVAGSSNISSALLVVDLTVRLDLIAAVVHSPTISLVLVVGSSDISSALLVVDLTMRLDFMPVVVDQQLARCLPLVPVTLTVCYWWWI